MGILDLIPGILGEIGGISPKNVPPTRIGNRTYLKVTDGDAAYDTVAEVLALITGTAHAQFFKIWQKTVEAQRMMAWGYGSPALQRNQGYMWFAMLDAGTDWDIGTLRIKQSKAREWESKVVAEIPDGRLHTTTVTTLVTATPTDINTMIPLPEKVEFPLIGEDSLMILEYALAVAATIHDVGGFEIPVTSYE
ncbi:MAG: hypothetical protein KKD44_26155 [Proteobacteria bacterium]|nr:hypothetical protein [Patescibacteria group bacterium]MBU1173061.1 hypothetical protein [Pseudomonadota bacterium]